MQLFPEALLKIRTLNKLYRVMTRGYPRYAMKKFGRPDGDVLHRLGSDYGGWFSPVNRIRSDWIIYSFGIGQDTTFDEMLIQKFGCKVFAYDPAPAAIEHIERRKLAHPDVMEHFVFEPFAVWKEDGVVRLFAPRTRGWVGSYSALNLQGTDKTIEVACRCLGSLMRANGHTRIDFLKMDIEGAEYYVLDELLREQTPVMWLAVEFDQPTPFWTTQIMLRRLERGGFMLQHVDHWNFTFKTTVA